MTTVLVLDPPCAFINANDRLHHHAKAKLTKTWRRAAYDAALVPKRNVVNRAHVIVAIRFPTNHRRDVGNYYPTAKAILDGSASKPWMSQAACSQPNVDGDMWHADAVTAPWATREAVRICRNECPAQPVCLAVNLHEREGVWGGLTESQRKTLRAKRRQA